MDRDNLRRRACIMIRLRPHELDAVRAAAERQLERPATFAREALVMRAREVLGAKGSDHGADRAG